MPPGIDTERNVVFQRSSLKTFWMAALGAAVTLLFLAAGLDGQWWGWAFASFFGVGGVYMIARVLRLPKVVYTLSPSGIALHHYSDEPIPWAEIKEVKPLVMGRFGATKLIKLYLGPGVLDNYKGGALDNQTALQADFLDANFSVLREMVMAYWQAHGLKSGGA